MRLTVLASLALVVSAAPRAPAQDRQVLDDISAGNAISVRTIAQLNFVGLNVGPDVETRVFRLPAGGWGVSVAEVPGVVQCFDAAGAPTGTFDHSGEAPGQLGGEAFAVPVRGELWVIDPQNSRLSIYTRDLHLAGGRRLNMRPFFIAPARDRQNVIVSGSTYAGGMYYAVARVLREPGADDFGDPLGRHPLPVSQWLVQRRMAAETAGGEVWALAMSGGAIDVLRSSDLSLVTRRQLPGKELAQQAQWRLTDLDKRPAPRLLGIAADSAGLLWLTFGVADRAWTPGMDPRDSIQKYFDTRIIVIDPAKRVVVGKVQFDPVCMPVERNLVSCVDEAGRTIRIVALQLKSRRRADP